MINVTPAQATAAGFTLIKGAGERVQLWSGADAGGDSVMYVMDAQAGVAVKVDDYDGATMLAVAAAAVLVDLVQASGLGAATKTAKIKVITDALEHL